MPDQTPEQATLIAAVKNKQLDLVSAALKKGAAVNTKDKNGLTALQHVVSSGYTEIARILRKAVIAN